MYRRILVPLDGSELAECALPHVEGIAKAGGTEEVILVSVAEASASHVHISEFAVGEKPWPRPDVSEAALWVPGPEAGDHKIAVGKQMDQAERYLDGMRERLQEKGIKVRTKVLVGNPAQEISSLAQQEHADLVIMASHGWSGISRWTHGSVADKVFRASSVPVLMVRAPA